MNQRSFLVLRVLCWVGLSLCFQPAFAERAEPTTPAGAACLYRSKSYSDGAFICVQKRLMLNCSSDGMRATWKVVADTDLAARCVAPAVAGYSPAQYRHTRRKYATRHETGAKQVSARCFTFHGKQYCE
jgi:hypothetical protein